ncbi:MAG: DMT family transporter [Candidatus Cryosericum sp.]
MKAVVGQKSAGPPGVRAWAGLIMAVLGVSGTSTYMKLAGTDPLVTAFWRLALSAVLLLPLQMWRRRNKGITVGTRLRGYDEQGRHSSLIHADAGIQHVPSVGMLQQLRLSPVTAVAGAFLALHFGLWVTSLSMTSVLSSLVFVTMSPLFVAVLSLVVFHERTSRLLWVAVAVVTAGGMFIGLRSGTGANAGNLLALGGALAASCYLIVGRRASRVVDSLSYNLGAFAWAALLTGALCVMTRRPVFDVSGRAFFWLAVTAVLGQTVGHGLINVSLKWFQPQFVALMLLWEPILGSGLAFLVLGDRPGPAELVGGAVVLLGLVVGIASSNRSSGDQ